MTTNTIISREIALALIAAVKSAGAWAERFGGNTVYPPHLGSGIKSLYRQGRQEFINELKELIDSGDYDVTDLEGAEKICDFIEDDMKLVLTTASVDEDGSRTWSF